jgi:hypothetical protein
MAELDDARDGLRQLRNMLRAAEKIDAILEVEAQSKQAVAEAKKEKAKIDTELKTAKSKADETAMLYRTSLEETRVKADADHTRIREELDRARTAADGEIKALKKTVEDSRVLAAKAKADSEDAVHRQQVQGELGVRKANEAVVEALKALEAKTADAEASARGRLAVLEGKITETEGQLKHIEAAKAKAEKDWDDLRQKLASVLSAGR